MSEIPPRFVNGRLGAFCKFLILLRLKRYFLTCMAPLARLSLFTVSRAFMFVVYLLVWLLRQANSIMMQFSLKSTQFTVKQRHQMSLMFDVLPKTCLGCGAVVVSLGEITVLQTSVHADYDTKKQKLRFQILPPLGAPLKRCYFGCRFQQRCV